MPASIWKFQLQVDDEQVVEMPEGGQIMCVQTQGEKPCLWARVDPDAPIRRRWIAMRGTGHEAETVDVDSYVGTFQLLGGDLVFHVFDRGEGRTFDELRKSQPTL